MGGVLGKKKSDSHSHSPPKVTEHDKAVLQLRHTRDKTVQYRKKLELEIERQTESIKEFLRRGEKDRARRLLRVRKYQAGLLEKTEGELTNVEELINSVEFAQVETQVFKGLESGVSALKTLQSEMPIEKVEQLMADTEEALAYQQEIDEILGHSLSSVEDAEIDSEIAELEAMLGDAAMADLPAVPTHVPTGPTQQAAEVEHDAEASRGEAQLAS